MGDFFPLGILFAMFGSIFVKKKLKVSAIFSGLKTKALLFFKEHGVDLFFLPTSTIEKIASQVFDRSGFFSIFFEKVLVMFHSACLNFILLLFLKFYIPHEFLIFLLLTLALQYFIKQVSLTHIKCSKSIHGVSIRDFCFFYNFLIGAWSSKTQVRKSL